MFVKINAEDVSQLRELKRGDHIAVMGEYKSVKYYHHGIFLGHSIGVADFGGTNKMDATIRIVDILEFTENGKRRLVRYDYKETECLPLEEAARNAENLVDNPKIWGAYDLVKNNCEHFATKCKIGRAVSFQVLEKLPQAMVCSAVCSATVSGNPCLLLITGMTLFGASMLRKVE